MTSRFTPPRDWPETPVCTHALFCCPALDAGRLCAGRSRKAHD